MLSRLATTARVSARLCHAAAGLWPRRRAACRPGSHRMTPLKGGAARGGEGARRGEAPVVRVAWAFSLARTKARTPGSAASSRAIMSRALSSTRFAACSCSSSGASDACGATHVALMDLLRYPGG